MISSRISQMCFAAFVGLVTVSCGDVRGTGPGSPTAPTDPAATTPPRPTPAAPPSLLSGAVFEPGVGPLAGVAVVVRNGATAVTDGEGRFSVAGDQGSIVSFASAGFMTRYFRASGLPGGPSGITLPLQRDLRIDAPGSATARLFPDDPAYLTDTEEVFWENTGAPGHDCSPCKAFSLSPSIRNRLVRVRVRWSAPVTLTVSLGGHYEGVQAQRTAEVGEREVTVQASSAVDTLLIGVASPPGIRQAIPGPIDLHIDVTLP